MPISEDDLDLLMATVKAAVTKLGIQHFALAVWSGDAPKFEVSVRMHLPEEWGLMLRAAVEKATPGWDFRSWHEH